MIIAELNESNQDGTTVANGSLSDIGLQGVTVLGLAFAGTQTGNVGTAFSGFYGTLTIEQDGSFSYILDNLAANTDLLSTGEQGVERFVVTYLENGVTQSTPIEITISGLDEAGQQVIFYDEAQALDQNTGLLIARDTTIYFDAQDGFEDRYYGDDRKDFVVSNYGSVSMVVQEFSSHSPFSLGDPRIWFENFGRVEISGIGTESVTGVIGSGNNFGVISVHQPIPDSGDERAIIDKCPSVGDVIGACGKLPNTHSALVWIGRFYANSAIINRQRATGIANADHTEWVVGIATKHVDQAVILKRAARMPNAKCLF